MMTCLAYRSGRGGPCIGDLRVRVDDSGCWLKLSKTKGVLTTEGLVDRHAPR